MTDLELLEKRIKRSGLQDMVVGFLVFLMAALVLVGAVTQWNSPKGKPWFMLFLGPLILGVAGVMVTSGRRQWSAQTTRLFLAATGDSKDVAWVHLTVGSVNAMKVHFIDGETSTVHANRKDAERLLGFMVQRAPGAIFGFGPGQQKQFVERQKAHRP